MVIGLRLRTNEREVTWRYPVAVEPASSAGDMEGVESDGEGARRRRAYKRTASSSGTHVQERKRIVKKRKRE